MKNWLWIAFSLLIVLGCKKPDPHPELLDPIYLDLQSDYKKAEAEYASSEASLKVAREAADHITPQTREKTEKRRELFQAEQAFTRAREQLQYFEIRLSQRKSYAKKSYMDAYNSNKPWPSGSDYQEYLKAKNQQMASRRWEDRIEERMHRNKKPKAKQEDGGGHGVEASGEHAAPAEHGGGH